jgi:DNA-binding transcriptional LysR family regulator
MPATLDIVTVRSFVAIAEHGGYHRAAAMLHVSQSTISQHVRRLEVTLGRTLLVRDGRGMRLTPDGQSFLAEAGALLATHDAILRRFANEAVAAVVVGSTEHGAEYLLPHVRAALARELPDAPIRFRFDRGHNLDDGLDHGTIDVAILLGPPRSSSARAGALPLAWYAAADWMAPPASAPLPLVAIDAPCTIRRKAIATLDRTGRRHVLVAEAGHLAGVLQAVRAGVGVALLAHPGPPPDGLRVIAELPPVEPEVLHVRASSAAHRDLAGIVASAVQAALP